MVEAVEDVDESMNSVQRKRSLNGFWFLTKLVLQEKKKRMVDLCFVITDSFYIGKTLS